MTMRGERLATAESVTAGHLQSALSLAPRAMNFFEGGVTTYNLKQKSAILSVSVNIVVSVDCVSQDVSIEMAKHVTRLFDCDWGIAATGYASPVPEKNIKELFACYAFYNRRGFTDSGKILAPQVSPLQVTIFYTNEILARFLARLLQK